MWTHPMVGAILLASRELDGTLARSALCGVLKKQVKNGAEAESWPGPSKLLTEAAVRSFGDLFRAEGTP